MRESVPFRTLQRRSSNAATVAASSGLWWHTDIKPLILILMHHSVVRSWWSRSVDETSPEHTVLRKGKAFHVTGSSLPRRWKPQKSKFFERNTRVTGWGNVSMFDKTFGELLWKRIGSIFGTITNRVCQSDVLIKKRAKKKREKIVLAKKKDIYSTCKSKNGRSYQRVPAENSSTKAR